MKKIEPLPWPKMATKPMHDYWVPLYYSSEIERGWAWIILRPGNWPMKAEADDGE